MKIISLSILKKIDNQETSIYEIKSDFLRGYIAIMVNINISIC